MDVSRPVDQLGVWGKMEEEKRIWKGFIFMSFMFLHFKQNISFRGRGLYFLNCRVEKCLIITLLTGWRCSLVIKYALSMHKALGLIPSTDTLNYNSIKIFLYIKHSMYYCAYIISLKQIHELDVIFLLSHRGN